MAVTELAVAMAQAKLRDDIVRGFVPNPHDHLVETRYLSYARSVGIRVGPGRGSAAGSLVAYVLDITNLDPIPQNCCSSGS